MPPYIAAHPLGSQVWEAINAALPTIEHPTGSLVHLDFWSGNILWNDGVISAVVDWEEAAQGDASIDLAYCRMDMFLLGYPDAAATLLEAYEACTGEQVANLGFWQLAASVRPMFKPEGWISDLPAKERFADFVNDALQRIASI